MTSVEHIRSKVEQVQKEQQLAGACRIISKNMKNWIIENTEFDEENVTRIEGRFNANEGLPRHLWVKITRKEKKDLIIDPAIKQFTKNNWFEQKVEGYIEEEKMPTVGVIEEGTELFDRYADL